MRVKKERKLQRKFLRKQARKKADDCGGPEEDVKSMAAQCT